MTNSGNSPSHWPWFMIMEQIVGNSLPAKATSDDDKGITSSGATPKKLKRNASAITSPVTQINKQPKISLKWRRVVFKVSGAALAATAANNILYICTSINLSSEICTIIVNSLFCCITMLIAREVVMAYRSGVEVAIVVGGRNFG
ncbi:hypothetical protein RchiOBHm_Chr5g0071181 [Rosa chinensis]|uniref:Uncharacterized protein n=1 Tax=Rosa chinensis TaxID=74649 RepID=A0A2P6QKC3_ROSCH|nr:hypothetical protein RchiOBHm_Chr5g0071181 [Rosa chinensis]